VPLELPLGHLGPTAFASSKRKMNSFVRCSLDLNHISSTSIPSQRRLGQRQRMKLIPLPAGSKFTSFES
jgi:hypothetical protein